MVNKQEYKKSLSRIDRDIRICIKYLEGRMEERFNTVMKLKQPQQYKVPKVDFSKLNSKDDSLQKQINGIRKKVDVAYSFVKDYDVEERELKYLAKKAEQALDLVIKICDEIKAKKKKAGVRK